MRDHYEYKEAMFVNSLFKDFLIDELKMKTWKDESTRDIICLEFNFGSRSYQKELEHLHSTAYSAWNDYKYAKVHNDEYLMDKKYNKRKKISDLLELAYENKHSYYQYTKEEVRNIYYNNGVTVEYVKRDKDGNIKKSEKIHYKMLYRSTGKAKKGSCMFIVDKFYEQAHNYLYMGIHLPEDNPMIVEASAYAPLTSSAIVDKIKINPNNILILKDIDRTFKTKVISIETDENKHCYANKIDNYELKNTLFDGQALIDSSIFPSLGNGYILLRHHFCKMAAFCSHIQKFFKDYFGDNYYSATVEDMFGNTHYVKDIQLITTNNAMKWLKFDISYDYWCDWVYKNNCMFGIVKTAHESKLGDVQKMSYQMVNSLDESIMDNVTRESVNYVNKLKSDNNVFLDYLENNNNFSNDYDVLIALCKQNKKFINSSYFRERKNTIIKAYISNMKTGKIIQNAENLVIVGSPYAMLLYGATGYESMVDMDDTFCYERGTVQCYTERFDNDEYLAFFRSPFNAKNNLIYLHNVYDQKMRKYFNFGKQIIAINMIGSDVQDRGNGLDMDSDSGYTTNQKDIVEHARKCYLEYPTIVNNIPKSRKRYKNTLDDYAYIDNELAKAQIDIGESSNLAQIAQTYSATYHNEKYQDYVCILSVLAQVAIDNAKRQFDIDLSNEIRLIKKDMNIDKNCYPEFWKLIKRNFKGKINKKLNCPMNQLCNISFDNYRYPERQIPISDFFNKYDLDVSRKTCIKIENLITKYSLKLYSYNTSNADNNDYLLLRSEFEEMIHDIKQIRISKSYMGLMSWIIDRSFFITPQIRSNKNKISSKLNKNRSILLKTLYEVNQNNFLKCFKTDDEYEN